MRALVTLAVLVAMPAAAIAQPSLSPLAQPGRVEHPRAPKSERTATALALGTTGAGIGLMLVASKLENDNNPATGAVAWTGIGLAVVGPSMGHVYAGEYGHAIGTSLLRGGAATLVISGLVSTIDLCFDTNGCEPRDHTVASMAILGGLALYVGTTAYDLVDASRAAHRTNDRAQLSFAPTMLPTSHGLAPGVAALGSF